MAVLRYWDGSAWQPVQLPNIYAANAAARIQTSALYTVTTTMALVPNTTITQAVVSSSERFLVTGATDIQTMTAANSVCVVALWVDGVEWTGTSRIILNGITLGVRATPGQAWLVTGLSPGNHTFALAASMSSGGGYQINALHTSLTVVSLGPPPSPPGQTLTKPLMAKISATATQSLTSGVSAQVVMGTTDYDTAPGLGYAAMADVANNQINIRLDGYYVCTGHVVWASNATNYRGTLMGRYPASVWIADDYSQAANGTVTISTYSSDPVPFNAGDSVQLWANQGSGAALNLINGNTRWSSLSAQYVGPL
jgi:hypothetical protein